MCILSHYYFPFFSCFYLFKKQEFLQEDEETKSVSSRQGMSPMTNTTCRSTNIISLTYEMSSHLYADTLQNVLIEQNGMVDSTDDQHVQNVCNIEKNRREKYTCA